MWYQFNEPTGEWDPLPGLPGLDGWLYGYSVLTTFRWPMGEAGFTAHLARVSEHATALHLQAISFSLLKKATLNLLSCSSQPQVVRMTAVAHPVGLGDFYQAPEPLSTVWLLRVEALPQDLPLTAPEPFLHLTVQSYQPTNPRVKQGSMASALALRRSFCSSPHQEIIWRNPVSGRYTEATTSNLFWLNDQGTLWTAPQGCVLAGVTRHQCLEVACSIGLTIRQEALGFDDLLKYQITAGWLSNSVAGLRPIHSIEDAGRKVLFPGTAASRFLFQQLYQAWLSTTHLTPEDF